MPYARVDEAIPQPPIFYDPLPDATFVATNHDALLRPCHERYRD